MLKFSSAYAFGVVQAERYIVIFNDSAVYKGFLFITHNVIHNDKLLILVQGGQCTIRASRYAVAEHQ